MNKAKWKENNRDLNTKQTTTATTTRLDSASLHCPAAIPFPRVGQHLCLNFNVYSRDLMFRCASLISTLIEKNKNKWNYRKRKRLLTTLVRSSVSSLLLTSPSVQFSLFIIEWVSRVLILIFILFSYFKLFNNSTTTSLRFVEDELKTIWRWEKKMTSIKFYLFESPYRPTNRLAHTIWILYPQCGKT